MLVNKERNTGETLYYRLYSTISSGLYNHLTSGTCCFYYCKLYHMPVHYVVAVCSCMCVYYTIDK